MADAPSSFVADEEAPQSFVADEAPDLSNIKIQPWEVPGADLGPYGGYMPLAPGRAEHMKEAAATLAVPPAAIGAAAEEILQPVSDISADVRRRTGIDPSAQPGQPIDLFRLPRVQPAPPGTKYPAVIEHLNKAHEAAAEFLEGLTAPGMPETLAFAGAKPVQALFGASVLGAIPPSIEELANASEGPEKTKAGVKLGMNLAMGELMRRGLVHEPVERAPMEPVARSRELVGPPATGEMLVRPPGALPSPAAEAMAAVGEQVPVEGEPTTKLSPAAEAAVAATPTPSEPAPAAPSTEAPAATPTPPPEDATAKPAVETFDSMVSDAKKPDEIARARSIIESSKNLTRTMKDDLLAKLAKPAEPAAPAPEAPAAAPTTTAPDKFKLTFQQFLDAPREGPLLDALRKLPRPEKTPEELAAVEKGNAATAALKKARLEWIYDRSSQDPRVRRMTEDAIRKLPKSKKKLVDAYEAALDEAEKASGPGEARQRRLYDRAVKAGIIESPEGTPEARAPGGEAKPAGGLAKDIRARLEAGEKPGAEAGGGSLHQMLYDAGRDIFKAGMDFARWSVEMVKQFGENVRDWLSAVWNNLTTAREWKAPEAPNQMPGEPIEQYSARLAEYKAQLIKSRIEHGLDPKNIRVTVFKLGKGFEHGENVQVDEMHPELGNVFSSNPDQMRALGFRMPTKTQLLDLPAGRYLLSDALMKLPGVEMRNAGIPIPGTEAFKKFIKDDVIPAVSEAAKTLRETRGQVRALLSPATMGPEAKTAAGIIRERRAELAQKDVQARVQFEKAKREMDKLSPAASLEFIDRVETGQKQPTPEMQTLADDLRQGFDKRVGQVRAANPKALKHLIQDYFPHIWKDPEAAVSWYARILGKRPLTGPKSFLKTRTIPLTKDGVAAGLEPVSWNPIEMSLLKMHEMDRYVMGQKIFQEFKDNGLAEFSRSDVPPPGKAKIDDRIANVVEYRPTTKVSGAPGAPERILRGHWYVQEDAARVLNNFLSPGLERYKWFRALRWMGNTLNMAQLGLSGYHFNFTMIDSATSKLALGIEQAAQGRPKGAATMARGAAGTVLANQIEYYNRGSKVLREYTKPGSVGGDYSKIVDALIAAGGRTEMPKIFKNSSLENFFTALRSGNYPGAVIRAPFAAIEGVSYPLMQNIVPRLKLGAFADMAQHEIERLGPTATRSQIRDSMGKIWDSVDNRMGELVYDNLFWNRTLKDMSFLAVRAVGWNLGTLRELGGGMVDSTKVLSRLKAREPVVTKRMAYLVALPVTVGIMGALYQKLKTGKNPEGIADYYYPQTGKTLPDGTPERVNFPSYLKDIGSYSRHPLVTIGHKLHPMWATVIDMLNNKDFYGTQIRNPDDPLVKQVGQEAAFLARQFLPFSVKGAQRRVGATESAETKAESFFGVMPISPEIARTTAQNKIMEYAIRKLPAGAATPEEKARMELRKETEGLLQRPEDFQKAQAELRKATKEGKLTPGQSQYQSGKLNFEKIQMQLGKSKSQAQWLWRFKHLGEEEAQHVYDLSTPDEKKLFLSELNRKRIKARLPRIGEVATKPDEFSGSPVTFQPD